MPDPTSAQQGIGAILTAPVATVIGALVGVLPLLGAFWKLFDWAYRLRIEALQERVTLRDDRLVNANEELTKVRQELEAIKNRASPELVIRIERAIEGVTASMVANTASITPSGGSYRSGIPITPKGKPTQ